MVLNFIHCQGDGYHSFPWERIIQLLRRDNLSGGLYFLAYCQKLIVECMLMLIE